MNSTKNNKFIFYSLILGFLGFVVATYLTILHYKNILPPCTLTSGCELVLTSKYASIFGVPVALLGSFFYLGVIILCLLILTNYKKVFLNAFYALSAAGGAVSLGLLFIQGYILKNFCQYCILSEVISGGIVILAFLRFRGEKS